MLQTVLGMLWDLDYRTIDQKKSELSGLHAGCARKFNRTPRPSSTLTGLRQPTITSSMPITELYAFL